MLCYLAFVWPAEDREKTLAVRRYMERLRQHNPVDGWLVPVDQPGLVVCTKTTAGVTVDKVHKLLERGGVVLGRIFKTPSTSESRSFDERESRRIIESGGRDLVSSYWGRYIAFLRDHETSRIWVLRDATGAIPCHRSTVDGVDVYFLRLEDFEQVFSPSYSINMRYVIGRLSYVTVCRRDTGIEEISMILPGECVEYQSGDRWASFYWNPLEVSVRDVIEAEEDATRLMRSTLLTCVHAWASVFDSILLRLSGGVDSSIVLACLRDAPTKPRVLCLNNYARGADEDERLFARRAASRAGFPLIEREAVTFISFEPLKHLRRAPYPLAWWGSGAAANDLLREWGISAVFTGDGGDELFFRQGPLPPVADYLYMHLTPRQVVGLALNDARADDMSFWRVMRNALQYGVLKRPWSIREQYRVNGREVIPPHVREAAWQDPSFLHPLFNAVDGVPPGKINQAYLVSLHSARGFNPNSGTERVAHVTPLNSQPLMELCLRIPLYVLRARGRDRAIVRNAFSTDLPPEIVRRRTKGGGNENLKAVLTQNSALIREMLLDGFLVREGLVDRQRLAEALSGSASRVRIHSLEILDYILIESWAVSWLSAASRRAA